MCFVLCLRRWHDMHRVCRNTTRTKLTTITLLIGFIKLSKSRLEKVSLAAVKMALLDQYQVSDDTHSSDISIITRLGNRKDLVLIAWESKSWMALPQRSLAGAKGAQLAMLSGWVGWHTLALPLSIKATRGSLRAHLLSRLHCHVTQHEQQFERRSWNASHVLKEARASLHPP